MIKGHAETLRPERRIYKGLAIFGISLIEILLLGVGILTIVLLRFFLIRTPPAQAVTSPVCGTWHVSLTSHSFTAVDALSKNNVWFAGAGAFARWDGTNLNEMPGPQLASDLVTINQLDVRANDDAWAVGYTVAQSVGREKPQHYWEGEAKTLALHWDGKEWREVDTPDSFIAPSGEVVRIETTPDPVYGRPEHPKLHAIAVIAPDDAWSVGRYFDGKVYRTLVEHWDGVEWKVVPSPNVGSGDNYLYAAVALSDNDVYAFGDDSSGLRPLAIHWDGQLWQVVEITQDMAELWQGISAASITASKDVWVVNAVTPLSSMVKEFGSDQWKFLPMPDVEHPILSSVAGISSDNIWAVGYKWSGHPPQANSQQVGARTLIMHWNGKEWQEVPGPDPSWIHSLESVTAVARDDIWVVGNTANDEDGLNHPMIAHFVGCSSLNGP